MHIFPDTAHSQSDQAIGIFVLPIFAITNFPPMFVLNKMPPYLSGLVGASSLTAADDSAPALAARAQKLQQRQQLMAAVAVMFQTGW